MSGGVQRFLSGLPTAVALLTTIPIRQDRATDVGAAVPWFPAVGGLIGALSLALVVTAGPAIPSHVSAILVVALVALLTGGLHLDGVADTFDALGGGRGDPARALAIMRDSRIGAHGAVALQLVLLAKVLAAEALIDRGQTFALLLAPLFSRFAVIPCVAFFNSARTDGLAHGLKSQLRAVHTPLSALWPAAAIVWWPHAWIPAVAAVSVALALCVWLCRRLGGLTGDVYGASIELSETAFLLAAWPG
ncbi:MAG: adenosylcobinamide-GDP ribazoletransferase [Myxococcales bacterium]|nr:adenosylcobinamide-GDP ribazoletransferase [Myxococcales bacterium]